MKSKSGQMTWRSRLAVAAGLGLAVTAAACSGGASSATAPSSVSPSSLAVDGGQSTRNFTVTIAPASVSVGAAALHVTVTRDVTSGQSQKLGSVEIYVPSAFAIQSVSNISNANWTSGVTGQTVRVGVAGGNNKLDGTTGKISITFDINVTSTECGTYQFVSPQAANSTYLDAFDSNWTYTGGALSVAVTCPLPQEPVECKAAPAVANEYLDSIGFTGGGGPGSLKRGDIISSVADHMSQGALFDGVEPCAVAAYRAAVIAYVRAHFPV